MSRYLKAIEVPTRAVIGAVVLAIGLGSAATAQAQWVVKGPPAPQLAVFDNAIHTIMVNHNITSAQLAVTWQGRLVLAHGYSLNPGSGDIVTDYDSTMRIASVSKQITSILINRLIQEGRLSLTSTLSQFVNLTPPQGQTADPRLAGVTVRNLLEHLAGFGNMNGGIYDPMFNDFNIASLLGVSLPISQANVITAMNGVPLNSTPGTTFRYSNYGYLLLGRIIESVTGMSYADYAASVFRPIGVWDMHLAKSELAYRGPREVAYRSGINRATVMNSSGAMVPYEYGAFNIENMAAHGGWVMSAVELVRILGNLDAPAAPDAILNQASINRMFSLPQNYPLPYSQGDSYYAHGWSVRDYGNGKRNTWHDGSLPGTTSYVVRTQYGWDYAVILNRRDETGATSYSGQVDDAMWTAYAQVSQWPTGDLFARWMPAIFRGGFD
ncbi:MAG TPA: serine hydrolase domain-containing protein [Rudaea sp.]|nr:serine hydrolase domain-containing protein [Rudaea sp.]